MRAFAALALLLLAGAFLRAQETGVILLDARDEHTTCFARPNPDMMKPACGPQSGLGVGRTVRFVVLHRRFMTDYSLQFGDTHQAGSSQRPVRGGEVRAIALAIPPVAAAGAPPVTIPRKTSADFLEELLDVTASSEPADEIDRENDSLNLELPRIRQEIAAFRSQYDLLIGTRNQVGCGPPDRPRNGFGMEACLHAEYDRVHCWAPNGPVTDEHAFRALVENAGTLFADVQNFGAELAAADLVTRSRAIESDIVAWRNDVAAFRSHLMAATAAAILLRQFESAAQSPLTLQLHAELRKRLSATAVVSGSKPALDDAETNALVGQYVDMIREQGSLPQWWRARLEHAVSQATKSLPDWSDALDDIHTHLDVELPALLAAINDWQEHLAAELNDIWRRSDVALTEQYFDPSIVSAPAVVSWRVERSSEFEPYVFRHPALSAGLKESAPPWASVEVSRGTFAVSAPPVHPTDDRRTLWEILRFVHSR
jgi:hypothetical protein